MSRPTSKTIFKNLSQIDHYKDDKKYYCSAVVFSPDTENEHFSGCPPYIRICKVSGLDSDDIYFKVPEIVAYYAKTHPGYTMAGIKKHEERGRRQLAEELKRLLNIKE